MEYLSMQKEMKPVTMIVIKYFYHLWQVGKQFINNHYGSFIWVNTVNPNSQLFAIIRMNQNQLKIKLRIY